jgi:hypothetical protein
MANYNIYKTVANLSELKTSISNGINALQHMNLIYQL